MPSEKYEKKVAVKINCFEKFLKKGKADVVLVSQHSEINMETNDDNDESGEDEESLLNTMVFNSDMNLRSHLALIHGRTDLLTDGQKIKRLILMIKNTLTMLF